MIPLSMTGQNEMHRHADPDRGPDSISLNLELTFEEQRLLLDILQSNFQTLRQEIYHAEVPHFKDELKQKQRVLESILRKAGWEPTSR